MAQGRNEGGALPVAVRDPPAQSSVMLFQAGTPVTADLFGPAFAGQTVLLPKALHAFRADAKTPANFAGAFPVLPRSDDPRSQILTQRPHKFPFMKEKIADFAKYVCLNRKCSKKPPTPRKASAVMIAPINCG